MPKRQSAAPAVIGTAALIGVVLALVAGLWLGQRSKSPTHESTLGASAQTAAASTTSTTPSYLPAGAKLLPAPSETTVKDPAGQTVRSGPAVSSYDLAGAANSDTIPAGGSTAADATTVHPSTELQINFVAGLTSLPAIPADPKYFDSSQVTIAGNAATLTTPASGYGVERLDWVDGDGYHVVMVDRLKTTDGTSGIAPAELERVAASLYQ